MFSALVPLPPKPVPTDIVDWRWSRDGSNQFAGRANADSGTCGVKPAAPGSDMKPALATEAAEVNATTDSTAMMARRTFIRCTSSPIKLGTRPAAVNEGPRGPGGFTTTGPGRDHSKSRRGIDLEPDDDLVLGSRRQLDRHHDLARHALAGLALVLRVDGTTRPRQLEPGAGLHGLGRAA